MDKFCGKCGTPASGGGFCEECGAPLDQPAIPKPVYAPSSTEPAKTDILTAVTEQRMGRNPSRSPLPLILGGGLAAVAVLVGAWLFIQSKYSPEVLDAFPQPAAQPQEAAHTASPEATITYEDFVGNWIPAQDSGGGEFWIQQVENRYVGADDLTIMEFSGVEGRTLTGIVTDGPLAGARVQVTLSAEGNGLSFLLTQDHKPDMRYEAARNTSLGQGTIMTGDIEALETMVADAFRAKEESQGAQLTEKETALASVIHELGDALRIYYVEEGRRELAEAQTHLREFLMSVTYNGFGMSVDFVEAMVQEALQP